MFIGDYIGATIGIHSIKEKHASQSLTASFKKWVVGKIMIPFFGALHIRCRIRIGIQKGIRIFTTTQMIQMKDKGL